MAYTKLNPEEIKREVCRIAKLEFAEKGILSTEMKEIANKVGIGRATLYRYYPNIESIAYVVAADYMKELTNFSTSFDYSGINGYNSLLECQKSFFEFWNSRKDVLSFFIHFDAMYPSPYPDTPEAKSYVNELIHLYEITDNFLNKGISDGSIKNETDIKESYSIISQAIVGYIQRAAILHHEKESESKTTWLIETLLSSIKA